ncbi:MAG: signal peptidase I [Chloroflexi bacterium]|nr:signal peptidase I [Chloroflexota bacterium]NOG34577.1 signal peptidase I [Chloroflexota bacterium]
MIGALFGGFGFICWLAIIVLIIAGFWKTFEKAGQPGWAAIIPIYNLYVLCLIAGRPGWWVLLYFIPFVNIVVSLLIAIDVAKAFGKDVLYGVVLLWLFQAIGYLLLGFGDAQYIGPAKA